MEIIYAITFFIFGICFGSFCNVIIYRLPRGESVNFPASHCPKCSHTLKFYHNIPLFSWIFLRGRCAFCNEKISARYPIVELCGGILFMLSLYFCEFKLVNSVFLAIALVLLLALSFIDFEFHAVPEIPLMAIYFCALFSTYNGDLKAFFASNSPLVNSLIFAGAIVILKSCVSAWMSRKNTGEIAEAMGDADTIVIATIGALFGGALGVVCVFLGGVLQLILHLILRKKSDEAPFIPALSLSILVCLIFESEINELIKIYLEFAGIK